MGRTARSSVGGLGYHVLNRGNGRSQVFHNAADYEAFIGLLGESLERVAMRVVSYCLMPNHFHLVVWPRKDGDLSRWMQWLMTSHVRRYHKHHHTTGHVWQGRFKAFPIEQDGHFLTACRYVERNALRAGLVERAEDWMWGSLRWWGSRSKPEFLSAGPVDRPRNWRERVNQPETPEEVEALRRCVNRGTPFGSERWTLRTAAELGLESTTRPRGRPRKVKK